MRALLFLTSLIVYGVALPARNDDGVIQLPLRRHSRPTVPLRAQGTPGKVKPRRHDSASRRHMRPHAAWTQPLSRNFTDSGPFDDFGVFRDEVFTIDVTLGTPAKSYNVTLDYHWEYSFFFSAGHPRLPLCVIPMGGGMPWRRDYNPNASTTAVKTAALSFSGFNFQQPYVPAGCPQDFLEYSDVMYNDTLKIGSRSFQFPFAYYTNTWGNLDFAWPSDAILGLGRAFDNTDPTDQYGIYQVLNQLPKNVVTVYFDSKETSNTELNGQVTFGGVDALNCDSKWNNIPSVPYSGWSFYVTTFSYGKNFAVRKQTLAILKATTALITAPPNVVDYVVVQTGAEYDWQSDTYQLPCSKIGTLPDMVFQLGTFEYRLPDKDYIRQLPHNKPGQCTLMLDGGNYVEDRWSLGSTFGRSYCTLFDYDSTNIGFAKVIH